MKTCIETEDGNWEQCSHEQILVVTDLTDKDYLVPHAIAQAKCSGAHVRLIHVLAPSDVQPAEVRTLPFFDRSKHLRDLRVTLLGISREFESYGICSESAVREGEPCEVLREELQRLRPSRIIMGSCESSKQGEASLGAAAQSLVAEFDIPLFVAGPLARNGSHVTPERILHPTLLSGESLQSLYAALDVARSYRAELILLHVLDPDRDTGTGSQRTAASVKEALHELVQQAGGGDVSVRAIVTAGDCAEEIVRESVEVAADWVILGTGHSEEARNHLSITRRVLSSCSCPVLRLGRQTGSESLGTVTLVVPDAGHMGACDIAGRELH